MRVICVAGARPNFVKIKPVVDALERRSVEVVLVHTGQHYDPSMSKVFFDELGIREPDHHLEVGSGTHAQQTAAVMVGLEPIVAGLGPDVVVVVGDVNSTMAAALVAAKATVAVAHVEAGLRSGDWTMPEEVNRVVTDRVSTYLLAPSPDAVDNLRREGVADDRIHLVGNVMIDTLLANLDRARARPVLHELGLEPGGYGVVTLHRPSNVDQPAQMAALAGRPGPGGRRLSSRPAGAPPGGGDVRRPRDPARRVPRPCPRLPRLRGPGGIGPAGAHRLRRHPGGDHRAGRAVPHPARHHRAAHHRHRGHQRGRRARPAADRGRGPPGAERRVPPRRRPALWDGQARSASPTPSSASGAPPR